MNEKLNAVIEGTNVDDYGTTLTGDAIEHARIITLLSGYILEITTGMKMCRIPLSRVAEQYGVTARNKKTALRQLIKIYEDTYGVDYTHPRLNKALEK